MSTPSATPKEDVVIGIDVGGTGIKTGLFHSDGRVLALRRDTTPSNDAGARSLTGLVVEIVRWAYESSRAAGYAPLAVGIVVPGILEEASGVVGHAVNLGWRNLPLRDLVRTALDEAGFTLPLAFGHDVRAGALAESYPRAGDTVRHNRIAFVPIGTGIASALVENGRVVGGGLAGEIGQLRLTHGPFRGQTVEEAASARAIARRAGVANAHELADLVRADSAEARRIWDDAVEVLAETLAWIAAVSGATRIVVGGGLAESGDLLLLPLSTRVAQILSPMPTPEIVKARHGDTASARGAALLARAVATGEERAPSPQDAIGTPAEAACPDQAVTV
ncbi:ROK family protein [Mycetocola saprophilus]|uniref:ROK family protein n=1 Tax=Mycetocola saprophilus TaxID=76636 RepID=UPI0009DEC978|nr:ROK family protein [Mycetocola saprophilus]